MAVTTRVTGLLSRAPAKWLGAALPRHAAAAVAASVVAVVALVAATQLALVIPGEDRFPPLPWSRTLEGRGHSPGSFSQLRAGFVARVLGLGVQSDLPSGGGERPMLATASVAGSGADPRVVVAHSLTNDERADAFVIPSIPFTARTNSEGATRGTGEPGDCAPAGGTVWYRYSSPRDATLVATTFGSDHATALAVFEDDASEGLRQVGCDVDALGASQVVVPAVAARAYFFQVAAPAGGGSSVFNLDPLGVTRLASVSSAGVQGNGSSQYPSLSADGRYVAFHSAAQNLVPGDDNSCDPYDGCFDVFVHDNVSGTTERVSVSSDGAQANHASMFPAISGDGRLVAFVSFATNLVADDTNGQWDVFVHDRLTGRTERASVDSDERQGEHAQNAQWNDPNLNPPSISVSSDGRYVAFASDFPNLVANDRNACVDSGIVDWWTIVNHPEPPVRAPADAPGYTCRDIFVRDRVLGTTARVSVTSDGSEAAGDSAGAYISPDGRFVAFNSDAENLDPTDHNHYRDVFIHDRSSGHTELVSRSSSGEQGNANSGGFNERGDISISQDARYVAFISHASNFGPGDTNDQDVFLRDRRTGRTIQLPATFDSDDTDRSSVVAAEGLHAVISADGRFVGSTYKLTVVRAGETQSIGHVLLYDRVADRTTRVSVASSGESANSRAFLPELSADGRIVAFASQATNLDGEDANGSVEDVFVHEMPWAR